MASNATVIIRTLAYSSSLFDAFFVAIFLNSSFVPPITSTPIIEDTNTPTVVDESVMLEPMLEVEEV